MFQRHTTFIALATVAACMCIAPAAMAADDIIDLGAAPISAVDTVAADAAVDGKVNATSTDTTSEALDAPSTSVYIGDVSGDSSGGGCSTDSSGDSNADSNAVSDADSNADSNADLCSPPIEQCSAEDKDGLDANGDACEPVIVQCSADDEDGLDADGQLCNPTVTGCDDAVAGGGPGGDICGGGPGITAKPPVDGGGAGPAPLHSTNVAAGGGGPELPFTGLPLAWAIALGAGLMLAGAGMWFRQGFKGGRG